MTDKHISEQTEEKNIMVPVSEKFMLSIREASATSGNLRYAAGTGTSS